MLIEFIDSAMQKAKYEILEGDEGFYGEIPGFPGVWANAESLELCRKELQEVLEEWLLLKVRKKLFIPTIKEYNLNELLCEK